MNSSSISTSSSTETGFFAYHGIWAPGIRLFRNIGFSAKALLISLAFTVPLVLAITLYLSDTQANIRTTERELQGVEILRSYAPLLQHVVRVRNAIRAQAGGFETQAELARSTQGMEDALRRLDQLLAETGDPLQLGGDVGKLKTAWQQARSANMALDASGRTLFGPVVEAANLLSQRISDNSRLSLDAEFATAYSIATYLLPTSELTEDVGQLWGWSTYLASKGGEDAQALRRYPAWNNNVSRIIKTMRHDSQKVVEARPELAARMNLSALDAIADYQKTAAAAVFGGSAADAKALWTAGGQAVEAAFSLYDQGLPLVDELLQDRRDQLVLKRDLVAAVMLLFVGLAGYLFYSFYLVMHGGLKEVARHLHAMSEGDLTASPTPWGKDDIATLMSDLTAMQNALRELITEVRSSSDNIVHSSSEIASGTMDLSGRTEQTAANLEQSASAMEQIASTVSLTAESAKETASIADNNAEAAAHGGEVIANVVQTMEGIQQSSRKISDIIGVIDGIAFQTNILALNAAVEAARAGEQGRGFAVVAGEVRTLAQRSAEAAREIKALITSSVDQVESGTGIVREAGDTIGQLVGNAQRIKQLVAEIANGAREQSQGINQVGQAVQELDRSTQQNAALVEETAAAAGAQRDAAQALADRVARFQLPAAANQAARHDRLALDHMPVADFNFDAAIEAHRAWKVKLRSAIAKHEQLDTDTISRDDCCPLGKWLHGPGGQRYGSKPRFVELVEHHSAFHRSAGEVATAINRGRYEDAERLLNSGSEFARCSTDVSTVLSAIKRIGL